MPPVVAHADSQTGAHPEQEDRRSKGRPTECEQRGYRTEMENRECDEVSPADLPGCGVETLKITQESRRFRPSLINKIGIPPGSGNRGAENNWRS